MKVREAVVGLLFLLIAVGYVFVIFMEDKPLHWITVAFFTGIALMLFWWSVED